jgi:hypothetical protein
MITSFSDFLSESKYDEVAKSHGTIGRWIEKEIGDNPYLRQVTAPFLTGIDPTIRLANAIDMLNDFDKKQVFDTVVRAKSKTNESVREGIEPQLAGGKNVFKSFLKCITSLGLSSVKKVSTTGFLIRYETHECADDLVQQSMDRFRSLSTIHRTQPSGQNVRLFFGIDHQLILTYGITNPSGTSAVGSFAITKGVMSWIQSLQSKSVSSLKADLFDLHWDDLLLLKKIYKFMSEYPIGKKDSMQVLFDSGALCFSYYGVSRWDNGVIDPGEHENLKTNLKTRLSTVPWYDRILVKVSAQNFSISICFKLK